MPAAVEAGLSHGLKKRAGGLLPAHDTLTVLTKLAKTSQPAADLVKKLTGEDEHGKQNGNASPGGGWWRLLLLFANQLSLGLALKSLIKILSSNVHNKTSHSC